MKNANGTGTVYKLKDRKRRKPWVVRVTTGYSIDGKQLRKTIGTFETKFEAQKKLFEYLDNPLLYENAKFKTIKDLWYKGHSKKVSQGRLTIINSILNQIKVFDDIEINKINLAMLQSFFDNLDCSSGTKTNYKAIFNLIFEYALKNDYITVNKVNFIDIGKKEKVLKRRIFDKKEIDILWQNVNSCEYCFFILILLYTGLRISELLNLKNENIDFINNTISIKESKTTSGIRTIPIPNKIIHLFKENINLKNVYFLEENNKKISYGNIALKFKKILQKLGIEKHTIHDTRHTFATLLNNANANSTSITKLIGHSDFSLTENIYTHKDIEELRKAINLLN